METFFDHKITVGPSSIDDNGHVNNVEYVQWMQDAATAHATALGTIQVLSSFNATWVVREHRVKYLKPAFEGDVITVRTWVANLRKIRSERKYLFTRDSDGALLVEGETDWIFVDATTGKLKGIPPEIEAMFPISDPKS